MTQIVILLKFIPRSKFNVFFFPEKKSRKVQDVTRHKTTAESQNNFLKNEVICRNVWIKIKTAPGINRSVFKL